MGGKPPVTGPAAAGPGLAPGSARRRDPGKRVGNAQHQPEEEGGDDVAGDLCHRTRGFVGTVAETDPHGGQVPDQDQRPQEDGTGQVGPHGGDAVEERREGAVVVVDVRQREVMGYERPLHGDRGQDGARQDQPYITLAARNNGGRWRTSPITGCRRRPLPPKGPSSSALWPRAMFTEGRRRALATVLPCPGELRRKSSRAGP